MKKVYIVILNYNNWADTIECLESVLKSDYQNYQIILVDNNSSDSSEYYLKKWLNGELCIWTNPNHKLRNLSFPPSEKPIPYIFYTRKEIENMGKNFVEKSESHSSYSTKYPNPIIFIQTHENLGFAGGNNVGIKYALAKDDFEYIWLLNNDTVIEKNTLSKLIECATKKEKNYGLFGTALLYYDAPDRIQALGGKFNKLFATSKHIFAFKKYENITDIPKFDYIIGASLLMTRDFIKNVGLLSEDYFIYYEEIDLAFRAEKKGYKMFICKDSIVYHKESVTIKKQEKKSSEFSDYFRIKNRIKVTRKFNPIYLPFVYGGITLSIVKRLKRRQYKQAFNALKILLGMK
ncbi:MAG: glycosyltransferase family 2 protein [Aquificae bacterium]|nr:glycosyltransferase family 2 protein [Aquificota bacterium]